MNTDVTQEYISITPLISCIQKIVVYETKSRYFIVGSNNTETRFRVLKIDRTERHTLCITDDGTEYSQKQIRDLLLMIDSGNRNRPIRKGLTGLTMKASAFGIVGYVRFLAGYYMILITKRRKVAIIGSHTIYKIEDTTVIYIPNESNNYQQHPDESKYLKMFQNVDLSSNFYYSYSYDLTHTLQYNMAVCHNLSTNSSKQYQHKAVHVCHVSEHSTQHTYQEGEVEDAKTCISGFSSITNLLQTSVKDVGDSASDVKSDQSRKQVYGIRQKPAYKYVWNNYLLRDFDGQVHHDWVLYIVHGFLGQCNLNVYGRSLYLTLMARRSKEYAGTRFLKRGANSEGHVANEVETEQIVQDAATLAFDSMRSFTSFVQHRGSVPLRWSQDVSKMVPKPPILMDLFDPYSYVSGLHFNRLLRSYGAPIIILNLVKKREKRQHESILIDDFTATINFLNRFLAAEFAIQYIGFDMARINKSKSSNVLIKLAGIAHVVVKKTGFFHIGPVPTKGRSKEGILNEQQGVLRTNCVDCLDRTNTAQFVVGKCALAVQLHAMNVLEKPSLQFDTDCVRMLEELYEDHGDTLALQYGGSQLVHRIQTYRKIAPWTSHSRDIMQTLSRYYSNTFSDTEKQHAINLFLGIFVPTETGIPIWDLSSDYHYHNSAATLTPVPRTKWYSQWWDTDVLECLPKPCDVAKKSVSNLVAWILTDDQDERVNCYWDYYKPHELSSINELYCHNMTHSVRDFMPKFAVDCSPFVVRIRPTRHLEESGKHANKNPSILGKESTSSFRTSENSSGSSSEESDVDGDFHQMKENVRGSPKEKYNYIILKDIFPTMREIYGVEIRTPDKLDIIIYKRHAQIGSNASWVSDVNDHGVRTVTKGTDFIQSSPFPLDDSYHVAAPQVSKWSNEIYKKHVEVGSYGAEEPDRETLDSQRKFVELRYR